MSSLQKKLFGRLPVRNLRIGLRLRLAFGCVLVLMFLGSILSFWHLRAIRGQIERASTTEQRMTAVLEVDNGLLTLMNQLRRLADTGQADIFESAASRHLLAFQSEVAAAAARLRAIPLENGPQGVIVDSLNEMLDALPGRVDSMIQLARANDWAALQARLANEVDHTDDVVAALVHTIHSGLADSRNRLLAEAQQAERRTALILLISGALSLAVAALLGIVVTSSITRPLANLREGARSLAEGPFEASFQISGADELTHLAAVFNQTANSLDHLYRKLQLSEAHYRALIENASDLIIVVGSNGRITYLSPSCPRVLGYAGEELLGSPFESLVHNDDRSVANELVDPARWSAHSRPRCFALQFFHHDGSVRTLEGVATDLSGEPGVGGIVINARDISARRRAEQALRERDDQLRQAQKMEAIGRLAGGVAHDFNNLLTVINGYSHFLFRALNETDPSRHYAEQIRDAGEQAAGLTQQLLAFSRKQVVHPAIVNLNDTVRETEKMLRRIIGEDIELAVNLEAELGGVEADPSQLRQVLLNLAVNARDSMPEGGKLTIETARTAPEATFAEGKAPIGAGGYITLAVTDTGCGMDDITQQRIFEPFFTTKEQGKGTGLGLSTVYGIVTQAGGHVTVHSAPGQGATFRVYLPLKPLSPAVDKEATSSLPSASGRETILLVEDQPEVRRFAAAALQSYGYQILEAADGEQALRVYEAAAEKVDLVVTDVVMPGMNGVEMAKRIAAANPRLGILFVSGYTDSTLLRKGPIETDMAFLPKPYTASALAEKVRQVLSRDRSSASPEG